MTDIWGDPNAKSFKAKYIRRCMVDDARVYVHANLVLLVDELLSRATAKGIIFSRDGFPVQLGGYEPDSEDPDIRMGLGIKIPAFTDKGVAKDLNFIQKGDWFIYDKTKPIPEVYNYEDEPSFKPGCRELKIGFTGNDVKFVNLFVGLTTETPEKFTKETSDAVAYFQKRMGIEETGYLDWGTWQAILPAPHIRIASGFAGARVRALQAGLRCLGIQAPVNSRFGTETIRAVREMQLQNNLRVTGRVGYLEWEVLFDRA